MISIVVPLGVLVAWLLSLPTAQAQTSNVTCIPGLEWASNSKGQNPCLQAAWVQAVCNNGNFRVDTIPPTYHYIGPTSDKSTENACICSTVVYNLMSGCAACQNLTWISWPSWSFYCNDYSRVEGTFNVSIPYGTAVPAWAFDLPINHGDIFNLTIAKNIGDAPERLPASTSEAPSSTSSTPDVTPTFSISFPTSLFFVPSSSPSSSSTSTPISGGGSKGSSNNAGAIAGGVVGGVVGLGLIIVAAFFVLRRRQQQHGLQSPESAGGLVSPALPGNGAADGGALNLAPGSPVGSQEMGIANDRPMSFPSVYNPNDPSTYPGTPTPSHITSPQHTSFPPSQSFPEPVVPGKYSGVPEV